MPSLHPPHPRGAVQQQYQQRAAKGRETRGSGSAGLSKRSRVPPLFCCGLLVFRQFLVLGAATRRLGGHCCHNSTFAALNALRSLALFDGMGLRMIEPRVGVTLTVMSLALLCMLRRGAAFRSGSIAAHSRTLCKQRGQTARGDGAAAGRHVGPEGTELPGVMHRTVGAEELKVLVVIDEHSLCVCHQNPLHVEKSRTRITAA